MSWLFPGYSVKIIWMWHSYLYAAVFCKKSIYILHLCMLYQIPNMILYKILPSHHCDAMTSEFKVLLRKRILAFHHSASRTIPIGMWVRYQMFHWEKTNKSWSQIGPFWGNEMLEMMQSVYVSENLAKTSVIPVHHEAIFTPNHIVLLLLDDRLLLHMANVNHTLDQIL